MRGQEPESCAAKVLKCLVGFIWFIVVPVLDDSRPFQRPLVIMIHWVSDTKYFIFRWLARVRTRKMAAKIKSMKPALCDLLTIVYLCYMTCVFKTRFQVNQPWNFTSRKDHPGMFGSLMDHGQEHGFIKTDSPRRSKVCKLGSYAGILLCGWVLIRRLTLKGTQKLFPNMSIVVLMFDKSVWILLAVASFVLNWNLLLYMLPVLILNLVPWGTSGCECLRGITNVFRCFQLR